MTHVFFWNDRPVPFTAGETVASALLRAGITRLPSPAEGRVFCGIGACQGCLVQLAEGAPFEACLTPVQTGWRLRSHTVQGGEHA